MTPEYIEELRELFTRLEEMVNEGHDSLNEADIITLDQILENIIEAAGEAMSITSNV